jgi:hypothetical protein
MKRGQQIIALVALVIAAVLAARTESIRADQTASPSTQPADFIARLANGVSVQLIGIYDSPSPGKKWWKANGDPLNAEPYLHGGNVIVADPSMIEREFAVKIQTAVHGSSDPATVTWTLLNSGGFATSALTDANGNAIPDLQVKAVRLADDPDGAILRAQIAAGLWTPLCTCQGIGITARGGLFGSYLFSGTFTAQNQTHILVGCSNAMRADIRLLAIDQIGRATVATPVVTSFGDSNMVGEFRVAIPVARISYWLLQYRPFDQWIEIRHISLHRDQKTRVEIVTSDGKTR